MKRRVLLGLVGSMVLMLAVLGSGIDARAHPQSSPDNLWRDLAAATQPAPPLPSADPAAPVRKATPGTDLADVPLVPVAAPESVIGPDGRVWIGAGANSLAPWRWVAQLITTGQSGSACQGGCLCTGFLVAPATVITAGHCVYGNDLGGWAASVRVAPGKELAAEPFGWQVEAEDLWSVNGWIVGGDPEFDYGAVIVDRAFSGLAGHFRYANIAAVGQQPRLSGYPGDHVGQQWWDDDLITDVGTRIVSYEIDTYGGQSGSPVWYPSGSDDPEVLAIHTRGVGDPACLPTDNCGTRIEASVMGNFAFWRGLGAVGGVAELPDIARTPLGATESSGTNAGFLAAPMVGGALAIAAAAWYARRRWGS